LNVPQIWTDNYDNGLKVYGIEQHELPLINFSIVMKGGLLLDSPDKIGVANLITDELMQGTKNKTPIELEEAIDDLGANIGMYTSKQSIVVNVNCLESKINEVTSLVKEILLEPRWDEKEFERALEHINTDPHASITAASSIIEAVCKTYIRHSALCGLKISFICNSLTVSPL
jgi:zinc protease